MKMVGCDLHTRYQQIRHTLISGHQELERCCIRLVLLNSRVSEGRPLLPLFIAKKTSAHGKFIGSCVLTLRWL